jgi:hypothetical protein
MLLPRLFAPVGLAGVILGVANVDGYGASMIVRGLLAMGIAAATWRVNWQRVSPMAMRVMVYLGVLMTGFGGVTAPRTYYLVELNLALALVWAGFALERRDVVTLSVVAAVLTGLTQWRTFPPATAVWHTVGIWLVLTTVCGAMHWLRRLLDDSAAQVAQAQAEVAEMQVQTLAEQQRAEAERGEQAAVQLAEQARLQQQVAEQAATLAQSAAEVSQNRSCPAPRRPPSTSPRPSFSRQTPRPR